MLHVQVLGCVCPSKHIAAMYRHLHLHHYHHPHHCHYHALFTCRYYLDEHQEAEPDEGAVRQQQDPQELLRQAEEQADAAEVCVCVCVRICTV